MRPVPSVSPSPKGIAHLLPAIVAALVFVAVADSARANIVTNGSFEGTTTNASYGAGSTAITGWTVFAQAANPGATVQWIGNGNGYGLSTPYGNNFLDLTGQTDSAPYAGVFQSLVTSVGSLYRVTFALGYNPLSSGFAGPVSASASVDGFAAQTFITSAGGTTTIDGSTWQLFEYDFTARATASVLRFNGLTTAGGYFIGLDNVAANADAIVPVTPVTPPTPGTVPEPASIALIGLGLVAGLVGRRRTQSRD